MEYRGKYPEWKRTKIVKDVLTQNSLDAIFAKAKLLFPDWILDLKSSSVKFCSELDTYDDTGPWPRGRRLTWARGPPGSPVVTSGHHPSSLATNELLTRPGGGWADGWDWLQIWTSLAKFSASVCWWAPGSVRGSRGQNGIILGQALKPGTLRWWESDPGLAGA